MFNPTTRLLTILELLQTHPALSGAELARRLEVEPRTVRRYIVMLQDMGMPVESTYGPGGGYRLRPGFKLPPLLFTVEEATALVLGLLSTARLEIDLSSVAIEGALAKVLRVLPQRARERLNTISAHLILSPHDHAAGPDPALLLQLNEAIALRQRVAIAYRAERGFTERNVEPYALAGWWGRWYMVGFCCLRQEYRSFRLDRIERLQLLTETFQRDEGFDAQAFVQEHIGRVSPRWQIRVEFRAPLAVVRQQVPTRYGTLTATPTGTLFSSQYDDLNSTAHYLMGLNLPFVIHDPPELRAALLALAQQAIANATAPTDPPAVDGG